MSDGGTGKKFTYATVVAGVASSATLLSVVSIWLQAKNYRNPLLQRYVIRILLMVPIYSIASWTSMVSLNTAAFLDPVRDIYEAFTIYTFFQLLINYLGGERSLTIMAHGRAPVQHLWPLNYALRKVDMSDPHTFLSIKRGILQYAWLKPVLALATVIMKATGTYQEGYLALDSGYLWTGIVYNISVTVSLYSLGLFWACMHKDLQPFRPIPKFLCIKLIIFASYWQGFFLSILVWLGAIPDNVEGYTRDNLAAAIQDALICIEMPVFAVAHWYAFSWHDFADNRIKSARLPLNHAMRDAFGVRDLIEDSKETFRGNAYGYRAFDSGNKVIAHEDSKSRLARLRAGLRYERGGRGKYWILQPGEINATSPLLESPAGEGSSRTDQLNENAHGTFDEPEIDTDDEHLFTSARHLEFGDWNYPVITANQPLSQRWHSSSTTSLASRASAHINPITRPPRPATSAGSQDVAAQQVVPVKKKNSNKIVRHADPDLAELGLGQAAPASASEEHPAERALGARAGLWEDSVAQPSAKSHETASPALDGNEFRNVWANDK